MILDTCLQWCPQGSALGLLMFALYINDLPSLVSSQLLMFADDIKLHHSIRSVEDCFVLQNDINIMLDWSNIGCYPLMFQNVRCYTLAALPILAITH